MAENDIQKKKDRIADNFLRHFNHFGFKKTSVDDVAKEMQISKKTIYQFFSSKEEVYSYVIERVAETYRINLEKKLRVMETCRERILKLNDLVFHQLRRWVAQPDAFDYIYKYEIASAAFRLAYTELYKGQIELGMQSGELKPGDAELTARFIQGVISQGLEVVEKDPAAPVERTVAEAIDRLLG